jgi:hypothetical protein
MMGGGNRHVTGPDSSRPMFPDFKAFTGRNTATNASSKILKDASQPIELAISTQYVQELWPDTGVSELRGGSALKVLMHPGAGREATDNLIFLFVVSGFSFRATAFLFELPRAGRGLVALVFSSITITDDNLLSFRNAANSASDR